MPGNKKLNPPEKPTKVKPATKATIAETDMSSGNVSKPSNDAPVQLKKSKKDINKTGEKTVKEGNLPGVLSAPQWSRPRHIYAVPCDRGKPIDEVASLNGMIYLSEVMID